MMDDDECGAVGGMTEVLGENLPQYHIYHMTLRGL
jgi:hypothetical protein